MPTRKVEIADREQATLELERTLRAMDGLPKEERMLLLRELAARGAPKPTLEAEAASRKAIQEKASLKEFEQERLKQFKRLCKRFWLSQHASSVLGSVVGEVLAGAREGRSNSKARNRLSPLEEIVWNLAPFFKHSRRTDAARAGRVAWDEVAQFLDIVQESWRECLMDGVKPSTDFSTESRLLGGVYKRLYARASRPAYGPRVVSLLARQKGVRLPKG